MKHAVAADGTEKDRRRPGAAKDLDAQVDLAHVDEAPWTQLKSREPFAIPLQRRIVVHAGGHVAPVSRRQHAARRLLEVHDGEDVGGAGGRGGLLCPCARSEQGTRGEELEKEPSVGCHLAGIVRWS